MQLDRSITKTTEDDGTERTAYYVEGPSGIIQFVFFTLPTGKVLPLDVGYHAHVRQYETQIAMPCNLLASTECFYDGSSLRAIDFYRTLVSQGEDVLWTLLENEYTTLFGELS